MLVWSLVSKLVSASRCFFRAYYIFLLFLHTKTAHICNLEITFKLNTRMVIQFMILMVWSLSVQPTVVFRKPSSLLMLQVSQTMPYCVYLPIYSSIPICDEQWVLHLLPARDVWYYLPCQPIKPNGAWNSIRQPWVAILSFIMALSYSWFHCFHFQSFFIVKGLLSKLPAEEKKQFVELGIPIWFSDLLPYVMTDCSMFSSNDDYVEYLEVMETITDALADIDYFNHPQWNDEVLKSICNTKK